LHLAHEASSMRGKPTFGDGPRRVKSSERFRPNALNRIRSSPARGSATVRSSSFRTSDPAGSWITAAFIVATYRTFNAGFHNGQSKRRRSDRAFRANAILAWAANHSVHLSDAAEAAVRDGCGEAAFGEDACDALAGLLKMIEVTDGRWPEATVGLAPVLRWRGWALGR
jgi:hypothetical protein